MKIRLRKREVVRRIWQVYLDACLCDMDYSSHCTCEAHSDLGTLLLDMLGPNWHDKCRKEFG